MKKIRCLNKYECHIIIKLFFCVCCVWIYICLFCPINAKADFEYHSDGNTAIKYYIHGNADEELFKKTGYLPEGTIFDYANPQYSGILRFRVMEPLKYSYDNAGQPVFQSKGSVELLELVGFQYSTYRVLIPDSFYMYTLGLQVRPYTVEKYNKNALKKYKKKIQIVEIYMGYNDMNVIPKSFCEGIQKLFCVSFVISKNKRITISKDAFRNCGKKAGRYGMQINCSYEYLNPIKFTKNCFQNTKINKSLSASNIWKNRKKLGATFVVKKGGTVKYVKY